MMSIFNIFDPMNSYYFSLNWLSMLFPLMFLPNKFWMLNSRWNMIWVLVFEYINNEINLILKKKIFKISFVSIFSFIMMINLLGLFSYIFTSSSHMTMNLSMALTFWLSFMIIGWMFNFSHMLTHQLPHGTPAVLMPFMVIIEFISNFIRPITLSVRLTANMIAGHLLLTLISNNGNKLNMIFSSMLILSQTILMTLELSVAIIQAYVFTILLSLYSQEI